MSKELEALEALNEIKAKYQNDDGLLRRLSIIEKSLKALEIIKTRLLITTCNLEHFTNINGETKDKIVLRFSNMYLTKEEYDLLKEMLK